MINQQASFRERIEAYIKEYETIILTDLQQLISFRTVSEENKELREGLDWFLRRAANMGFSVFKTTTNDVGVVEAGQGEEILGILVHLDVVDAGDPLKWRFPPFEGTIAEGSIWGRGAMDDKGAAIICLYGMKALLDLGVVFHKKIRLIIGTSEEGTWTDMQNFKNEFRSPDYGFTPDGDFPIYNMENGYTDVVLLFDEAESREELTEFDVYAGKSANTIPSRATLILDGVRQTFDGISAHSSTPELGDNAILKLCAQETGFHFCRFINEILACDIYGDGLDLKGDESCWEGQNPGLTRVAPTILRKAGDKVLLNINIRQNPSLSKQDIEEAFHKFSGEYQYEFSIPVYQEAMRVNSKRKPFAVMAQTYEDWGYKNRFIAAAGTSYAKAMKDIVTWGPCFPEDLSCAHQENERIGLRSLFRAMGIYTDYMYRIVSDPESYRVVSDQEIL